MTQPQFIQPLNQPRVNTPQTCCLLKPLIRFMKDGDMMRHRLVTQDLFNPRPLRDGNTMKIQEHSIKANFIRPINNVKLMK